MAVSHTYVAGHTYVVHCTYKTYSSTKKVKLIFFLVKSDPYRAKVRTA